MTDNKAAAGANSLRETIASAVTQGMEPLNERFSALEERMSAIEDDTRDHSLPGSNEATHRGESYSFSKVLQGLVTGEPEKYCPMELEMSNEIKEQNYAQGVVPDTAGGFLVPAEVHNEMLIPLLQPRLIASQLGFQQVTAQTTPFIVPTVESDLTDETVAENQGSGTTEVGFGEKLAEPHTSQAYIEASRRFMNMGPGAESLLRDMMANKIARTQNEWALKGTGADGQPTGVLNTTGVGSVSWSGADLADVAEVYPLLLEHEQDLADANALEAAVNLRWCCPYKFIKMLRQMKSENNAGGTHSMDNARKVFSSGAEREVVGYEYTRTNFLSGGSSAELIFGDWNELVQVNWGNLSLEASAVAGDAMKKRQMHLVAYMDVDFIVRQAGSFAVASGLDLSSI